MVPMVLSPFKLEVEGYVVRSTIPVEPEGIVKSGGAKAGTVAVWVTTSEFTLLLTVTSIKSPGEPFIVKLGPAVLGTAEET
jgi:hypothetical protein